MFLTVQSHGILYVTSDGDRDWPPDVVYVNHPFLATFISDSIFCTSIYPLKMASSELLKSDRQKYTSTLPKTAIRSDFKGPPSSKSVPIGGHDFAKLVYIANARQWLLAVSVIHPLVIIGCQ